jgi:hypothetical protein
MAVAMAVAPLLVRLAWWWWRQRRVESHAAEPMAAPAMVEHTELRMTKRLLGRWKVKMVSTRWQSAASPLAVAPNPPAQGWKGQLARLGLTGLERALDRQGLPAGSRRAERLSGGSQTSRPLE